VRNGLARLASGGEVTKRAGEFETGRPDHNGNIVLDAGRTCQGKVYCVSLTPSWTPSCDGANMSRKSVLCKSDPVLDPVLGPVLYWSCDSVL
jgi:hypothetical protein